MLDHGESFLELLKEYEEQGIELNRIVLEITEHNFEGDIEQLYHMLAYYRTYGIKIAVDNIGKESREPGQNRAPFTGPSENRFAGAEGISAVTII